MATRYGKAVRAKISRILKDHARRYAFRGRASSCVGNWKKFENPATSGDFRVDISHAPTPWSGDVRFCLQSDDEKLAAQQEKEKLDLPWDTYEVISLYRSRTASAAGRDS